MSHYGIGLLLTKKCNAECDICCYSCSPREKAKMSLERALDLVEQAARIKSIRSIGIAGGEPFLYYDELTKIVQACRKHSISATCTTNGFWARTEQIAFEIMSELKELGVTFMTLSVDDFHSKFVPYAYIRNVLRVSKKIQMGILINTISTKNSKRLKDIVGELGDDVMGIRIMELPCSPVGNAAIRIDESEFITEDEISDRACSELHILTITPEGEVYPCCSEAGIVPPLCLGSVEENTLDEIIKNFYKNPFCYILAHKGVKWFYDIIKENNIPIKLRDKYVGMCDLCNDLFKNKENLKFLKPLVEEIAMALN